MKSYPLFSPQITYMGGRSTDTLSLQNLDWHVLGERALKAFKSTPCVNFK